MKTSCGLTYFSFFTLTMLFVFSTSRVGGAEEIFDQTYEEFQRRFQAEVISLTNASLEELKQVLSVPLAGERTLADVLGPGAHSFYPANLDRFVGEALTFGAERSMDVETRIQYYRRFLAAGILAKTNDCVVVDWLLARKGNEEPLILDGLVVYAIIRQPFRVVSEEDRELWRQFLNAPNPLCRLLAVARARTWAPESEIKNIIVLALADPYYHTRDLGLSYLSFLPPKDGAALAREYLDKAKHEVPSAQAKERANRLIGEAQRILTDLTEKISQKTLW